MTIDQKYFLKLIKFKKTKSKTLPVMLLFILICLKNNICASSSREESLLLPFNEMKTSNKTTQTGSSSASNNSENIMESIINQLGFIQIEEEYLGFQTIDFDKIHFIIKKSFTD